jgi:hypothetical protein
MMPLQTVWMIRLSLVWLLTSVLIGALILLGKAVPLPPMVWALLPVHYELAIWGWMVQFVIGTAYWMFPKYLTGLRRGPQWAGWLLFILINAGVILLCASHLIADQPIQFAAQLGRGSILIGILAFILLIWNRVTTYRR